MNLLNIHPDEKQEEVQEQQKRSRQKSGTEQNVTLIRLLLTVVVILLICILILSTVLFGKRGGASEDRAASLQQDITDYASEQKKKDGNGVDSAIQDAILADSTDVTQKNSVEDAEMTNDNTGLADTDKTAVVVSDDATYSKEYMLSEMMAYFEDNNLDAVWDLAYLKRYRNLSMELKDTDTYYYMGDVDSSGLSDGIGLAIYENDTYYYGSWSHGLRSGDGRWYRFYFSASAQNPVPGYYLAHSYSGQWSKDLPNGEGSEHYDVDTEKVRGGKRIIQNVVGNFTNGLYDGEMFATTIDYVGNVEEWYGTAENGVFSLWRDMSSIGECAVWKNKDDKELCLDIDKSENKNQGMRELLEITQEK